MTHQLWVSFHGTYELFLYVMLNCNWSPTVSAPTGHPTKIVIYSYPKSKRNVSKLPRSRSIASSRVQGQNLCSGFKKTKFRKTGRLSGQNVSCLVVCKVFLPPRSRNPILIDTLEVKADIGRDVHKTEVLTSRQCKDPTVCYPPSLK